MGGWVDQVGGLGAGLRLGQRAWADGLGAEEKGGAGLEDRQEDNQKCKAVKEDDQEAGQMGGAVQEANQLPGQMGIWLEARNGWQLWQDPPGGWQCGWRSK